MVDVYSDILGNGVEPCVSALGSENIVLKNSPRKRKKYEITPELRNSSRDEKNNQD